jgi:hypothetical protein
MAWLTGWTYRKPIVIGSAANAGTNYQVRLLLAQETLTGTYDFDLGGHANNFPSSVDNSGDIRFTSSDGSTLLDFWVEGETASSVIASVVEVVDNLSSSNATIYCYYGKVSASNVSNGANTFLAYDDFESGNLNNWTEKDTKPCDWAVNSSYVENGTYGCQAIMTGEGDGGILVWNVSTFQNCKAEVDIRLPGAGVSPSNIQGGIVCAHLGSTSYYQCKIVYSILPAGTDPAKQIEIREITSSGTTRGTSPFIADPSVWYKLTVKNFYITATDDLAILIDVDDVNYINYTDTTPRSTPASIGFWCSYHVGARAWYDNFRVSNFVSTEPDFSSSGNEERDAIIDATNIFTFINYLQATITVTKNAIITSDILSLNYICNTVTVTTSNIINATISAQIINIYAVYNQATISSDKNSVIGINLLTSFFVANQVTITTVRNNTIASDLINLALQLPAISIIISGGSSIGTISKMKRNSLIEKNIIIKSRIKKDLLEGVLT